MRRAAQVLSAMLALAPAMGIPGEWVLQDTLKSALVACGTVAAVVFLLAQQRRSPPGHTATWQLHGMLALPALWCLYALGSMVWSHTYLAGAEAVRWAVLGSLLWACLQVVRGGYAMTLVWGVHAGAVGASAWCAAQFWGDLAWFPQAAAPASVFVNRNFFAEYLVASLPLSALALTQTRTPRWRVPMALSLALNIVALLMTGTRSALLAAVVLVPLTVGVLWRYRKALATSPWSRGWQQLTAAALLAGVVGGALLPTQSAGIAAQGYGSTALERSVYRVGSVGAAREYTEGSFSIRALMWRASIRMLLEQPLAGVGAGAWEVHIPRYQGSNNSVEADFYAHNEFLQLLAEYGVVVGGGSLAVLLGYLLFCAQALWQAPPPLRDTLPEATRALALCSLLGLMVVSNAGFPWRLASTGALFMLGLAIAGAPHARAVPVSAALVRFAQWGAAFAGVAVLVISGLAFRAEYSIVRSIQILNLVLQTPDMPETQRTPLLAQARTHLEKGLRIHPHYRKLTAQAADRFAASGDWRTALWALDSLAASRPFVPDIAANQVLAHLNLNQNTVALAAWKRLAHLQSDHPRTRALEVLVLRRTGQHAEAAQQVSRYLAQGLVEYDLVQAAVALGLEMGDQALTLRGYRLWVQHWPAERAAQAALMASAPAAWGSAMASSTP
jgi:O-antigen ligase